MYIYIYVYGAYTYNRAQRQRGSLNPECYDHIGPFLPALCNTWGAHGYAKWGCIGQVLLSMYFLVKIQLYSCFFIGGAFGVGGICGAGLTNTFSDLL